MLHDLGMRPILWLPFSCAVMLTLSGCANMGGSAGSSPSGTGPFDSQGNYHEEWANDPSKWRKPGSHSQPAAPSDELPVVANYEQPPPNASPFAAPEPATRKATARHTEEPKTVTSKPKATAHKTTAHKTTAHVDSDTHKPTARKTSAHADTDPPKTSTKTRAHADTDTPKTRSKTASKAPAKGSRYTVKKGDTLYTIAEHSNSSAAEIRKANGLSGNTPKPGKSLVIPK